MEKSRRIFALFVCLLVLLIVFGCKGKDERQVKLEKGIRFIQSLTGSSPADKLAAGHYQASTPEGMSMLYHASLPGDGSYPNVCTDRQNLEPWTLLILPGNKENTLIVEGYGDDLQKPVIVEEITVKK
ncbi:MAG TPA: hypothetical protein PLV50_02020 [Smithella sp.]|nr:hypothetical protein [Smithella sp.]MDM7988585.1 hypothetical protein [Smithella sp.]HNY49668.1 hypothetical protein [Smithella sp.]HOG89286.1 hypothetical protein [Smithella sp.]HOU50828.1 hypothetical protein [Smithella sp.]